VEPPYVGEYGVIENACKLPSAGKWLPYWAEGGFTQCNTWSALGYHEKDAALEAAKVRADELLGRGHVDEIRLIENPVERNRWER
jgi:hypothetical protein